MNKPNQRDFNSERFEVCVLHHPDPNFIPYYMLISCLRVKSSYYNTPEGIIVKSIRGADLGGEDCSIEDFVAVNHNADVIFRLQDEQMINGLIKANKGFLDIYDYEEWEPESGIQNKFEFTYTDVSLSYADFVKMDKEELKNLTL